MTPVAALKNAAVFVLALLVAAIAVELIARAAGFAPRTVRINRFFVPGTETTWSVPDSELGWINKEGVSRSVEDSHAPMTFWDNSRRATVSPPGPAAGRIPIMVIGGSNAQAYSVRDEETFVSQLAARFPRYWFENFGTGGYSTVQATMLAERALDKFYRTARPKLVILGFDDSHMLRNVSDQSWVYSISDAEGRYVAPPHYRVKGEALDFRPFRTIGFWPVEKQSAALTVIHNVWLQSFAYRTGAQAFPVTQRVLRQLDRRMTAQKTKLMVAVLEDRQQVAVKLFDGMPFPWIDCSGLERNAPERYLVAGGSHPNAALHAHFADCIGGWLDANAALLTEAP